MTFIRIPLESRLLLAAASAFVPSRFKTEWRREWEGEIWWWISTHPGAARGIRERLTLAALCSGAMSDGVCLWFEDEDRLAPLFRMLRTPSACLAAGVLLLALVGVLSGGFDHTRRALGSAFHPHFSRLAVLSQTGPFMGQSLGVPARKVSYWDLHAGTLDGAAVYSFSHTRELLAAKVGARFFSLVGARSQLGRVFAPDDRRSCTECAVLGYEFWKRQLGADPAIVGRTITVDHRRLRVIGVLSRDFWFLGETPAVWSLFNSTDSLMGAVCLIKPGVAPDVAVRELRMLARQVAPPSSGTWVTITPLDVIVGRPLTTLGALWLGFVLVGLVGVFATVRSAVPAAVFLLAKTILILSIVLIATLEFAGATSVTWTGGTTWAEGAISLWVFFAAAMGGMRWVWSDQFKRCRTCLSRLTLPVRFGEGCRILLEPSGTEMACPHGHGTLFTTEGLTAEGSSIAPKYRWAPLDASWRDLFVIGR